MLRFITSESVVLSQLYKRGFQALECLLTSRSISDISAEERMCIDLSEGEKFLSFSIWKD